MSGHLIVSERKKISQMQFAAASKAEISRALGQIHSIISRELERNSVAGVYSAVKAQSLAEKRRAERPIETKMTRPEINAFVRRKLTSYWSPEQITGRMVYEGKKRPERVSRSTVERWIRQDTSRQHWESFLRHRGKRRPQHDRRGKLPSTVSITVRPQAAEQRIRCVDWEGDTIIIPGKRSGLVCHGKRTLKRWYTKDLRQVVQIPAGDTPTHRDAVFVVLLLEETQAKAL